MPDCDVCIGGDWNDVDGAIQDIEDVTLDADHKCLECGDLLAAGTVAERGDWSDIDDEEGEEAEPYYRYTCLACANIRSAYSCGQVEMYGVLWESLSEVSDDLKMAGECWDSLTAPAKAKLLAKWREWKGLDHV